ncbi:MAG: hypothetical protein ABSE06_01465 [Anaerolineaceae bacterium]
MNGQNVDVRVTAADEVQQIGLGGRKLFGDFVEPIRYFHGEHLPKPYVPRGIQQFLL